MKHKIKAAFDEVEAEIALKENTEAYVLRHIAPRRAPLRPLLAAAACLVLIVAAGFWSIFTPTAEISIDINPSLVLGVNRFDRVISLTGYNPDGEDLIRSLDVKFLNYSDAVAQIMANDQISALLDQDELMTIAVTGQNAQQSEEIYARIQSCTDTQESVYCYHAASEEAAQAHHLGLSHPRYQAYLALLDQGTPVDAGSLNSMSMKEIRELLGEHHEETTCTTQETTADTHQGHGETEHNGSDTEHDQNGSGTENHHSSGNSQKTQHQHGKNHS